MWHVSSRSGVATLRTAIHLLLTCLLLKKPGGTRRCFCLPRATRTVVTPLLKPKMPSKVSNWTALTRDRTDHFSSTKTAQTTKLVMVRKYTVSYRHTGNLIG